MITISKIENGYLITIGEKQFVAMSRWRQLSRVLRIALKELEKELSRSNAAQKTDIRQQKLTPEK